MKKFWSSTDKVVKLCCGFFALFLCLQAVVVFSMTLFGDDYYYATFTRSSEYFLSENIRHYEEVNGRVLVHLLVELLLWDKSLILFGILNMAAIGASVFFAAAIAASAHKYGFYTRRFGFALLTACALFGTLPLEMVKGTVYWATGSVNYLFPMAFLLAFTYFALSFYERGGGKCVPFLIACGVLVGQSTEQASTGFLAVCFYLLLRSCLEGREKSEKRRIVTVFSACFAVGLVCFATLFLAPGNEARTGYYPEFYAQPLIDRILGNVGVVVNYNIGENGSTVLYSVLLTVLPIYLLIKARELGMLRTAFFAAALIPFSVLSCAFYVYLLYANSGSSLLWGLAFGVTGLSCVAMLCLMIPIFIRNRDFLYPAFCLLAAALQVAMFLSPEIGARTCLCSALLLMVPVSGALSRIACLACEKKCARLCACIICACVCLIAVFQMAYRADKYVENTVAYEYNDMYVEKYKNGETEKLVFIMPDNNLYRYILPYDSSYFEFWYKQCHEIPTEAEFYYDFLVYATADSLN
ncbi:MAG: hypothetical protein IIW21_06505 [Clostridia bacterium]|nr:hypothetical protein [Clostridia bacterium]